jgi:hypothetical protein
MARQVSMVMADGEALPRPYLAATNIDSDDYTYKDAR